jgi:hypothetical protein
MPTWDEIIKQSKDMEFYKADTMYHNPFGMERLDNNLYNEAKSAGVDMSQIKSNTDLEEGLGNSQSTSEKWLNDLGRLGTGALSSTVGGFAMIPAFFDAASSADLSKMYENGAVKWAESLDEWGQENFKNHYTKRQEDAYKEASIFEKITYGEKFWGNSVLANAGFMIGAAVDEMLFTGLSGLTEGAAIPLQAAGTGWLAARLARRLAEAGTEVMGSGSNLLRNAYRGFTAEGEIAQQAMMAGLKNGRQLLTSAGYESSVEALQFQKEAYNQVLEKKATELGITKEQLENNPEHEKTLADLKSGVNSVANGLWLMNLATVGSSNAIGATALFQLEKPILNMLEGINPLRAFMSAGVEDLAKTAGKEIGKDGVQFVAKDLSLAHKAYNIIKSPLSEGTEEFLQGTYQDVGKRYLDDKYNPSAIDMILKGIPLMGDEIGKRLGDSSHQGWEEFASGFMSSLLGLPNVGRFVGKKADGSYGLKNDKSQPILVGGIMQGVAENKQIQNKRNSNAAMNNALDDKYIDQLLHDKLQTDNITTAAVKAFPMIQAAQIRLAEAKKNNDKFAENQAKHDILAYAAIARDKIGQGENFKKDVLSQYDEHKAILSKGVTADSTKEEIDAFSNLEKTYEGNNTQEKLANVEKKKKNTEVKMNDIEAGIKRAKGFNLSPDLQDRMAVALSNGNNRVSEANGLLKALQAQLKLPNISVGNLSSNELYELLDSYKLDSSKHKELSANVTDKTKVLEEANKKDKRKKEVKEEIKNTSQEVADWQNKLDEESKDIEKQLNTIAERFDSPLTQYKQAIDKLTGDEKTQAESLFSDIERAINQHKESVKEYNKIMHNPKEIITEENTMRRNTARKMAGIVEKNEVSSELPEKNTSNNAHILVNKETTEGKITNVVHIETENGSSILVDTDKGKTINLAQVSFVDSELKGLMEEYIKQENALLPTSEVFEKQLKSINKDIAEAFAPYLVQLKRTINRRKAGMKSKMDNFSTHPTKLSPIESDEFKVDMTDLIKKSSHKKSTIEFKPLNTREEVPKDLQIIDVGDYETKGSKELPETNMFYKSGVKGRVKLAVTISGDSMIVYGIVPNVASFDFNYSEQDQDFPKVNVATIKTIEGKKTVVLTPEFIKVLDFIYGNSTEQKKRFVVWNNITGYESKNVQYGKDMEVLSLTAIAEKYKPNEGEPVVFWNNDKIAAIYLDGKLLTETEIKKWQKDNKVKRPTNKDEKAIVLYNGEQGKQKPKFQMDGITPRKFSWNTMGINEEADYEAIKEAQEQLEGVKTEAVVSRVKDKSATKESIALDPDNEFKNITDFRIDSPLSNGEKNSFLRIDVDKGSANIDWLVERGKAKLVVNRTIDKIVQPAVDLSKIAAEQGVVEESKFYEWLEKAEPEDIRNLIEKFLEKKNTKIISVYKENVDEHNKFENRLERGSITAFIPNIQWIATVSTKVAIKDIPGIGFVKIGQEIKLSYPTGKSYIGTVTAYDGKAITFKSGTPVILEEFNGTISLPNVEDKKKVTPSNIVDLDKVTRFIAIKKQLVAFLPTAENEAAVINWMNGLKNSPDFTNLTEENIKELRALCAARITEFKKSETSLDEKIAAFEEKLIGKIENPPVAPKMPINKPEVNINSFIIEQYNSWVKGEAIIGLDKSQEALILNALKDNNVRGQFSVSKFLKALPNKSDLPPFKIANQGQTVEFEEALNNIKDLAPTWMKVQKANEDMLRNMVANLGGLSDEQIMGWFDGIINLRQSSNVGTEYHELFHGIFNMVLDDATKRKLIDEALNKYPIDYKEVEMLMKRHKLSKGNAIKLFLEEKMADEFMDFMKNKKTVEKKSFLGRVFEWLKNLIFGDLGEIHNIFTKIANGKFKTAQQVNKDFKGIKTLVIKYNEFNEQTDSYIQRILPAEDAYNILNTLSRYIAFDKMNFNDAYEKVMGLFNEDNYELDNVSDEDYKKVTTRLATIWNVLERRENIDEVKKEVEQRVALYGLEIEDDGTVFSVENEEKGNSWSKSILEMGGFLQTSGKWRQMLAFTSYTSFEYGVQMTLPVDIVTVNNYLELISQNLKKQDIFERLEKITMKDSPMAYQAFQNIKENISKEIDVPVTQLIHDTMWGKSMIYSTLTDQLHKTNSNPIDTMIYKNKTTKSSVIHANAKSAGKAQLDKWVVKYNEVKDGFSLFEKFLAFQKQVFTDIQNLFEEPTSDETVYAIQNKLEELGISVTTAYIRECLEYNKRVMELSGLNDNTLHNLVYENGIFLVSDKKQHKTLTDVIEFINSFIEDEKQKLPLDSKIKAVYQKMNTKSLFYKNKWQTLKNEFPDVAGKDIYHNLINTTYVAPMFKDGKAHFSIINSKQVKDIFEDVGGVDALRGNLTKLANGNANFDESVRKTSYKTMDNKTVYETIYNMYVKEMERALSKSEFRDFLTSLKGREITSDDIDKFTEFLSLPNDAQTLFVNQRMLAWLQNSPLIDFIDNDFEVNFLGGFKEVKTSSTGESADSKKNLGMAFDDASIADSFRVGFINWKEKNLVRPILLSGKSTQLVFSTNRKLKDEGINTSPLTEIQDKTPVVTDKAVSMFKSLLSQELERIKWVRNLSTEDKTQVNDEIEGYVKKGSTFSQNTGFAKYLKENKMKDILAKLEQADSLDEVENIDEIIAKYMNNHLRKSYEFLQGVKTDKGYVGGKIQSTDDFFYKEQSIIEDGKLDYSEFAEYEIDSWLKSEILYQFVAFDKAMGLKGVIDTFKRAGSIIASGSGSIGSLNHVTIDDESLLHFIGMEEAQEDSDFIKENAKRYWDDTGGKEGFEEAFKAGLKGKEHKNLPPTLGQKVDRFDADSVATIETLIDHILVPQGKFNKEVKVLYDKIKVGVPLSHKEYEYLRLNNALNQKRKMSYVQGLFYKKTSTQFIGIEEFAFIKPEISERDDVVDYLLSEYQKVQEGTLSYKDFIEANYNVRIGRERMFNVVSSMYAANTQYLFFKTSSKQLKRNLIKPKSYNEVHNQIVSDRNSSMNTAYLREQMKTDGVKSKITHGTQLMQLVWSEQNPNNILYATKGENGTVITSKTLKDEYLHLLASRINFVKEKIKKEAGYDGSTLDTEVLRKIFGDSIMQNGGQNYLYEFVTEVDWNIPHTNEKVQNMFFSYLSKSLSQKREGTALALQSDFIHQIIRAKEDIVIDGQTLLKDEVIPTNILEKYYDELKDSDRIFVGRLRHGIWNGEFFYGEAIIPNIHEALTNGIPKAFQYGFKIRIPTQDKHSMMAVRFVDTMPGYKGSTIVIPLETIFLAGEDFDIDKAYLYWSAVYKNKQGEWKSYGEYTNVNDAWAEYKAIMKGEYKADAKSDYVPLTMETFFENIEDYITVDKEKQLKYERIVDKMNKEINLWESVNDIINKSLLVADSKSSKQKIASVLRNPEFEVSGELLQEIQELIEAFEDEKLFIYLKKIGEAYSKETFKSKVGKTAKGMNERMEQNKVGYRGKERKYNSKEELNNDLLYCELRLVHNKGNQNISLTPATMTSQTDLIFNEVLLDYKLGGTALRQFMEAEGIDSNIPAAIQKYIDVKGFAVRDTNHAPTDILKAENMEAIGEDNIGIGAKFSIVSQLYLDKIGTNGVVGELMKQNFVQIGAEYHLDGFYRINDVSSGVISAATDNAKEQIAGAIGHDRLNLPIIQSAQLLLGYHYFTTMTLRRSKKVAELLEKLSVYDDEKLVRAYDTDKEQTDEKLLKILKQVENIEELTTEVQKFKGFETAPNFEKLDTYNRNFLIVLLSLAAQDENFQSEEFENYALAKFKEAKRFANFNRNLAQISNLAKGVEINFGEIKGVVRAVHQAINDKEFGAIAQEILNENFLKAELTDMIDDMNIGRTFFLQGQKIFDGLENVIEETVGSKFYREKEYSAFRNGFSAFILSKIIKNQPNFDKNFLIASTQADLVNKLLIEVNERFPNNLLLKALTTKNVQLLSESERKQEEDETGLVAAQSKLIPRRKIIESLYGATEFKFFQTNTWAESNKFLTEKIQNEAKRWNDMTVNVTEIMERINKGEELSDIFDISKDRLADDKLKAFFNAVLFYQSLYKDNLLFRNGSVATILDPRMFKVFGVSMGEVTNAFNSNDNVKIKQLLGEDIIGVQREFLKKYLTSYDAYTLVPTLVSKDNDITESLITIKEDALIFDLSEKTAFTNLINNPYSETGQLITIEDKKKRAYALRKERLDELRNGLKEAKSDIKLDTEHGWVVAKFPLIIKNVTVENGRNVITRYVLKEVKRVSFTDKMVFAPISGRAVSNVLLKNTANLSPISFTELMSTETKKQEVFGNKAVYVKVEVIGNKDIKQYMIGEEEEWDDKVEEIAEKPKVKNESIEEVEDFNEEIVLRQIEETEVKKEINLSIYALRTAAINVGEEDINFKTVEAAYNAIKLFFLEGLSATLVDVDAKIKELQQAKTSQEIAAIMKGIKYNETDFNVDARDNMKGLIVDAFKDENVIEALMTQKLPEIVGFEGLMEEIRDEFAEQYGKQVKTVEDKKIAEEFKIISGKNVIKDVIEILAMDDINKGLKIINYANSLGNESLSQAISDLINKNATIEEVGEEIIKRCKI